MKHFKQNTPAIVGSYKPSDQWNKWTQFAVMDESTGGLLACTGYFQPLNGWKDWGFEDYFHAAECIEQAQLYANAPRLYDAVVNLLSNMFSPEAEAEVRQVLNDIVDISEPANRLLGENAMKIICAIEAKRF